MTSPLRRHSAPTMGRAPRYKHEIAALRKNSCERLQVVLTEYNGCDLVNLTVKRDSTGKHRIPGMRQTARYVSIRTSQLGDLIVALQCAQATAITKGILRAPESPVSARNNFPESITPEKQQLASVSLSGPRNTKARTAVGQTHDSADT